MFEPFQRFSDTRVRKVNRLNGSGELDWPLITRLKPGVNEIRGDITMARPIPLHLEPRDSRAELSSRLQQAPQDHAEAVLSAYKVLQGLHDRGVLEGMRGALAGGDKILDQVVAVASGPASIRATRNLLLLVTTLGEIYPSLLSDLTRAIPKA